MPPFALEVHDISKRYGDCVSLDGVSVSFEAGKIHAVVGENGAGKTTLLRITAGVIVPDKGSVTISGHALSAFTPRGASALGLGMVQQHFSILDELTVLENLLVGSEFAERGFVRENEGRERAEEALRKLGRELPLGSRAGDLALEDRQTLEIARLLLRHTQILVLDEPTAALAPPRVTALYERLRELASEGKTIIVVTHKLSEIVQHADRAVVLKKGHFVEAFPIFERNEKTADAIRGAMIGNAASISSMRRAPHPAGKRIVLRVKNVSAGPLRDVTLEVAEGEILGVAGIEGNGQRDLFHVILGEVPLTQGSVDIAQKEGASSRVAEVAEDRHRDGLVLSASVAENLVLGELERVSKHGLIREDALRSLATSRMQSIVPATPSASAASLSGGNQQKILVSRAIAALEEGAELVLLAHPTRGVDFAARADIHERLLDAIGEAKGAVLVSYDLDELRELATRIIVLRGGRIVAELPNTATDEEIGRAMLGSEAS